MTHRRIPETDALELALAGARTQTLNERAEHLKTKLDATEREASAQVDVQRDLFARHGLDTTVHAVVTETGRAHPRGTVLVRATGAPLEAPVLAVVPDN